jgi:hypothetical protein
MEVNVKKTSFLFSLIVCISLLLGVSTKQCSASPETVGACAGVAAGMIVGGLVYKAHKKIMDYYTDHQQEAMDIALDYDRYHVVNGGLKPMVGISGWFKKKALDLVALYHACKGNPGRMMAFALYFHNT